MTDLTEKWKSGELEKGAYYVKDERGNVYIDEYDDEYSCGYYLRTCFSSDCVSEVLAPVPSYEELQSLEADRGGITNATKRHGRLIKRGAR